MPWVQYVDETKGINEQAGMATPRRITELRWWLKTAQLSLRAIPKFIAESEWQTAQLPNQDSDPLWYVETTDVSERWVKFTLRNRWGVRSHIVIDRKKDRFTGNVKV